MLTETFSHLPGISTRGEESLHTLGIRNWNAFLRTPHIKGIGAKRKLILDTHLRADTRALENHEWSRFHTWPKKLHHRALPHLDRILYLDIETYGVKSRTITIIALSDSENVRILEGTTDQETLARIIAGFEAIITYNGNRFDLPYLKRIHHTLTFPFTIDLEPLCAQHGLTGGLKHIETHLGIEREEKLIGGDPLDLWRRYRASHDEHYLDILTAYASQDVLSLPIILDHLQKNTRAFT